MIILFFRLQCLFFFLEGLLCSGRVADCGHLIKIHTDYDCIRRFGDFESHVRVYYNTSLIRDMQENVTLQQKNLVRGSSRINNAHLAFSPVLITGSLRYRADLHIEISRKDLVNVETIFLVFSTRDERNEEGLVRIAAVVQSVTKLNGNGSEGYVRVGCYWHYVIFLADSDVTINLEMTLLKRNAPSSYSKYYFRIPYWEQFNNQHDINPCLFAPFVYAEEIDQFDSEVIFITSVNCSRRVFVEVDQRKESSGELIKSDVIYVDEFGRGNITSKYTKVLHYYNASISGNAFDKFTGDIEVSGEVTSASFILMSVLIFVMFILILILWRLKEPVFPPRNSVLFPKKKPRVKFIYSSDSKFHVYRAQTEILILFMEKYCNITVSDDSVDFCEMANSSLLLKDFDVVVHIPFPSSGVNDSGDSFTTRVITQWETTKKDCMILELPFWPGSHRALDELCHPYTKWKRFVLMDEFFPMLTHVQRSRSCFRRRYVDHPYTVDDIRRKLEVSNLTNEGFLFCLKEAFGQPTVKTDPPPVGFQNLQDMVL